MENRKSNAAAGTVHPEFLLEQLVQLASMRFQIGFARQAMRLLEPSDLIAFEATDDGLQMLLQNEEALARPLALLRDLHGENLVLRPLKVRYLLLGNRLHEPVMILRVRTALRYRDAVRNDLDTREATLLLAEHTRSGISVLRAEAPLRRLLGYGEALARLSGNSARHWIWFDRHAPIDDPPGGFAA